MMNASIRLLFIAMAATGVAAWCPCIGEPQGVVFQACTEPWAKHNTCIAAQKSTYNGGEATLPPDYAMGCHIHPEPFSSDCTDQQTGEVLENPSQWCIEKWCYVDPCLCDAEDLVVSESAYSLDATGNPIRIAYSYSNCDGQDFWNPDGAVGVDTFRDEQCSMPCSDIKDYYREQACCGMPDKKISFPMFYPFSTEIKV